MRREAAGELAELIGPAVLPRDRENRIHRFRDLAGRVVEGIPAEDRAIVEAYTAGVNASLASLGEKPFEYLALRSDPAPWLPEDCALVVLSMFIALHDDRGRRESALGLMHEVLPPEMFDFLATRGTEWDAPVIGEPIAMPPIPGPEILDLRKVTTAAGLAPVRGAAPPPRQDPEPWEEPFIGSNNWAVDGAHTEDGGAILANDMHLGLSVPNTWYRASLIWPGAPPASRCRGSLRSSWEATGRSPGDSPTATATGSI
jgi:penicillin amidase